MRGSYLSNLGKIVCGGLSLVCLLGVAREENKLGLVLIEALHVGGKALLRFVAAAVVHGYSNGAGIAGVDSCSLHGRLKGGLTR